MKYLHYIVVFALVLWRSVANDLSQLIRCKEPYHNRALLSGKSKRRFLLVGGNGAGIGNFLIFFPAAYYFAALTGRELVIMDNSLIAEMCTVLYCGFPLLSELSAAYPGLLTSDVIKNVHGAKIFDFHRHFGFEYDLDQHILVRADGYKYSSGWYFGRNQTEDCVIRLSGCDREDVYCHDRHALQRLILGPFKSSKFTEEEERRIIGVPSNLKHAMLTLPHSASPRLDAAVHLRCQFQHFEYLVGPEDTEQWQQYQKELYGWLNSSEPRKGYQLFKIIEDQILMELPKIREEKRRLRQLQSGDLDAFRLEYLSHLVHKDNTSSDHTEIVTNSSSNYLDFQHEHETYQGIEDDSNEQVYIYLTSDNEVVKEAFAAFLLKYQHTHKITVMRVKNNANIVHAKNLAYLRSAGNNTGVMDLVMDWYCMTLSNFVFAWRRDTDILSTFAHSAQRVSGTNELSDFHAPIGKGIGTKGFQLYFNRRGNPVWRPF